jgi:CHAT domain-containing protein
MPLHAAGDYETHRNENAADYIVSSYVPTLSALTKAHMNWQPVNRLDLTGLLVCEASSGLFHLPYVSEEICNVRECLERSSVKVLNEPSEHTMVSHMQALLECYATQAHILHLASHGVQEDNPLESAFLLQDGRLSVADIMRLELPRAVLAFLSACQTAKGDRNAPDQAAHLAASMLFCGFRSIVGTMWYGNFSLARGPPWRLTGMCAG